MEPLPTLKAEVIVIGGGAAGLLAAVTASGQGADTLLVEPNEVLGRKVRLTGKGRCNLTNDCDVPAFLEHVPTNRKFLTSCLTAFPPRAAMDFFAGLGVPVKTERGNRVFPVSDRAADVAEALACELERRGARRERARALEVLTENGSVTGVRTSQGVAACQAAILCTGGLSYPATGSTGDGYTMARALGHKLVAPRPSLVPLESPAGFCRQLAGFAPRNIQLCLEENGKILWSQRGEMLFTHFGVSGPLVLSASAHIRHWDRCTYRLRLDFKPALSPEQLDARIQRDFEKYRNRDLANGLIELLPRSLIGVILETAGVPGNRKIHSVTREERKRLGETIKNFPVPLSGPRPWAEAVVTAGGVDVTGINPRTMESRLVKGLYFAGEILDVDAYTGGFNLHIAWATGHSAGLAAAKHSHAVF